MNRFLVILSRIVISRGFIELNEQFLVRLCFIVFLLRIVIYSGDDIKTNLESKQKEILTSENEFNEKKKRLIQRNLNNLIKREEFDQLLIALIPEREKRRETRYALTYLELENAITNQILNELETIRKFEDLAIPRYINCIMEESIDLNNIYLPEFTSEEDEFYEFFMDEYLVWDSESEESDFSDSELDGDININNNTIDI